MVPGIPARHSMPAKPAPDGAAQFLHVRAGSDFHAGAVDFHGSPEFLIEPKDGGVDAFIGHQQIRAQSQHVNRNLIFRAARRRRRVPRLTLALLDIWPGRRCDTRWRDVAADELFQPLEGIGACDAHADGVGVWCGHGAHLGESPLAVGVIPGQRGWRG
jgi:hypothetical protein